MTNRNHGGGAGRRLHREAACSKVAGPSRANPSLYTRGRLRLLPATAVVALLAGCGSLAVLNPHYAPVERLKEARERALDLLATMPDEYPCREDWKQVVVAADHALRTMHQWQQAGVGWHWNQTEAFDRQVGSLVLAANDCTQRRGVSLGDLVDAEVERRRQSPKN